MKTSIHTVPVPAPDGQFLAHYSERGLCGLDFPKTNSAMPPAGPIPGQIREWLEQTAEALARALSGQPAGSLPPLDLSGGTKFQQQVWQALLRIPTGQTRTYGEVAAAIRQPKAVRAVGAACGANPIPVLVPCHRVLAAGGRLGGFSAGLDWKTRLLAREGSWPETHSISRSRLNVGC